MRRSSTSDFFEYMGRETMQKISEEKTVKEGSGEGERHFIKSQSSSFFDRSSPRKHKIKEDIERFRGSESII